MKTDSINLAKMNIFVSLLAEFNLHVFFFLMNFNLLKKKEKF